MHKYKIITVPSVNGDQKKKIYELTKEETSKLKKIGTASGPSFEFCFYLGWKHGKNFQERVCGYTITMNGIASMIDEAQEKAGLNKSKYINVEFYEKRN